MSRLTSTKGLSPGESLTRQDEIQLHDVLAIDADVMGLGPCPANARALPMVHARQLAVSGLFQLVRAIRGIERPAAIWRQGHVREDILTSQETRNVLVSGRASEPTWNYCSSRPSMTNGLGILKLMQDVG